MPFFRIHSKFKKGTVYFDPDAVKPLHLLGNIFFNGFDIYGMLQILVNILPPFSKHNRRRIRGKIENTHSITNFSGLISKVCINYGSPAHFGYNDIDSKDNIKNLKNSNFSFASFDKLFSRLKVARSQIGSENFFYINYIIFSNFYKYFLHYFLHF